MQTLTKKPLTLLIGLLSLSGCATTRVSDVCPAPHFFSCSTICELDAKQLSDQGLNDMLGVTNVMLKLHTDEKLGGCECR